MQDLNPVPVHPPNGPILLPKPPPPTPVLTPPNRRNLHLHGLQVRVNPCHTHEDSCTGHCAWKDYGTRDCG